MQVDDSFCLLFLLLFFIQILVFSISVSIPFPFNILLAFLLLASMNTYICICEYAILNMFYYVHIYILEASLIQRLCRSAIYVQPQFHLRRMLYLESLLLLEFHFSSMHKFYHSSRHYSVRMNYTNMSRLLRI